MPGCELGCPSRSVLGFPRDPRLTALPKGELRGSAPWIPDPSLLALSLRNCELYTRNKQNPQQFLRTSTLCPSLCCQEHCLRGAALREVVCTWKILLPAARISASSNTPTDRAHVLLTSAVANSPSPESTTNSRVPYQHSSKELGPA